MTESRVLELRRILEDHFDERWQAVNEESHACFRDKKTMEQHDQDYALIEPSYWEFYKEKGKDVIQTAAQELIRGERPWVVIDYLIVLLSAVTVRYWYKIINYGPISTMNLFERRCRVIQWLLMLENPVLDRAGIDRIAICRQISFFEKSSEHPEALAELTATLCILTALPRPNNELHESDGNARMESGRDVVPASTSQMITVVGYPPELVGEIAHDGIIIKRKETLACVKTVLVTRKLVLILATAWAMALRSYRMISLTQGHEPECNPFLFLRLINDELEPHLGTAFSRTNVSRLRNLVEFSNGDHLFAEGHERASAIEFRLHEPLDELADEISFEDLSNAVRGRLGLEPRSEE